MRETEIKNLILSIKRGNGWIDTVAKSIHEVIKQTEKDAIKQTEKAYGGCHNCYGKGYATNISHTIGYPDFIGDKGFKRTERRLIFCSCSRGQQLKKEMER